MNKDIQNIKRDSIKKSSIFNITIKLLTYLIPLILSPYLYRVLTFTGVGTYEYQYAYVTYFCLIATFGFNEYGTKRISSSTNDPNELNKRFWSIFIAKQFLGILCLIFYIIIIFTGLFGNQSNYMSLIIMSLFIIGSMTDLTFLYQGVENFKSIAIRTFIIKIVNLILIFCLVKSPNDYLTYVAIMAGCNLLSSLVMFLPLHKYVNKPVFNKKNVLIDLKGSFVLFIMALAISLYTTMQKTILGILTNETEVGYFSSATKIKDVVTSICYAIVPIFYSRVAFLFSEGKRNEVKEMIYKCFNALYDFVLPCTVGLICVANIFMPFYFGEDAINAAPILMVSSLSLPMIVTSSTISYIYLLPDNHQIQANIIYIVTAILNTAFSFISIKLFGAVGAAIGMVFTETTAAILCIYYSHKYINFKKVLGIFIKPFDAALLMGLIYMLGNLILTKFLSNIVSMFILIIISIIVYGSLLILFKDEFCLKMLNYFLNKFKRKGK